MFCIKKGTTNMLQHTRTVNKIATVITILRSFEVYYILFEMCLPEV